tara:strand:- start:296 stop:613 length:318 start_codon:yes stop_codon:yes gene_type:complete
MAQTERLNKMYRNKHNGREVLCTNVRMSDYGIPTWTLTNAEGHENDMTEYDMAQHWEEIECEEDVMDVDFSNHPIEAVRFANHPLAWRRRATPEEVEAKKRAEEE